MEALAAPPLCGMRELSKAPMISTAARHSSGDPIWMSLHVRRMNRDAQQKNSRLPSMCGDAMDGILALFPAVGPVPVRSWRATLGAVPIN
jgi:hypothetical protein